MIRTRIAPSPTGWLHIGTARTALFNYLFARRQGGTFVLRIEDTDIERSEQKYEKDIFEALNWLGIAADESPEQGGEYGPYRQSERSASYRPYLEELLTSGQAYYCRHTEAELEAEKKHLMASGRNSVHACQYRDGGAAPSAGSIIRFKTPAGRTLAFNDLIRGDISFGSDLVGDFSIAKDLATPLYNFAVVIDDHEMRISHIIRGEDHISNTPKQILLAEALGFELPFFAHLPLILGPDRAKLSKRHGATAIREFREQGYLAEALVNFMALLGWNPGGDREIFSMHELVRHFDLAKVQKAGAVFNIAKLDWINGEYIRRAAEEKLVETIKAGKYLPGDFEVRDIQGTLRVERLRLKKLSELAMPEKWYMKQPVKYEAALLCWKAMSDGEILRSLETSRAIIEDIPDDSFSTKVLEERFLREIGEGDKGILLWPLRVALTGLSASPGPFEIMGELGKARTIERISQAVEKLSKS